jgi:hypothetical protein
VVQPVEAVAKSARDSCAANVRFGAMYFHPLDARHGERDVGQPYGRASDDPTSRILNVAPVADLLSTRPDMIVQPDRPDQGAGPIENSVLATSFRSGLGQLAATVAPNARYCSSVPGSECHSIHGWMAVYDFVTASNRAVRSTGSQRRTTMSSMSIRSGGATPAIRAFRTLHIHLEFRSYAAAAAQASS